MITMRNFMQDDEHDETIMKRNQYVAFQDRDVLLTLHPKIAPRASTRDLLTPSDHAVGRYRQWLALWQARGWRIDLDEVSRVGAHTAFAIPSPARRNKKGWVIDPIPMLRAAPARAAEADQAA